VPPSPPPSPRRARRTATGASPAARFRAERLERAADLLEERDALFLGLAIDEAGKTLVDAVAEVREAVDFLRYYAAQARADFTHPVALPGPTGERNELILEGKGVFVAHQPLELPARDLPRPGLGRARRGQWRPRQARRADPADRARGGRTAARSRHPRRRPGTTSPAAGRPSARRSPGNDDIIGVAFTGSTEVARMINRSLAGRDGPIATLIAETGGANAMIVDSTALPEQVARDAVASAFQSAGQRCSALRLLCVQEDVADTMIAMVAGAMAELNVGDPSILVDRRRPDHRRRGAGEHRRLCRRSARRGPRDRRSAPHDPARRRSFRTPGR
jgi:RHH-type proline utilization regulon transcriptional repressor/proline dehydrogenase/delta 1-pyrroline-5-carboxylate dehydrogenase